MSARLPDFVVIGEQKAGTGWIRDRLREHPDVFMYPSEVGFFSNKARYARGLDWYARLFGRAGTALVCGEKSPEYFWMRSGRPDYNQDIAPLIRAALPAGKIILTLRDPIGRAVSAFHHHVYHRGRRISPARARAEGFELLFGPDAERLRAYGVIERGFYAERVQQVQQVFGTDLLILVFEEDIVADPEQGLRAVCAHLGVAYDRGRFALTDNAKERKPSYARVLLGYHAPVLRPLLRALDRGAPFRVPMSTAMKQRLRELYAPDVARTEQLLGRSLGAWLR